MTPCLRLPAKTAAHPFDTTVLRFKHANLDLSLSACRFIGLQDLRRALFDTLMRHHRAGRHDLVQALAWSFICA